MLTIGIKKHQVTSHFALSNIQIKVKSGEIYALIGKSGSGKSTLVKLLVGLYTTPTGKIYYNGIESTSIDRDELQQQLGFVTQDTQLFAGTIRENLLFTKPEATQEQLDFALSQASCESMLARSEHGIDTVIGEGGMKLSGGEKQRLSIARALIRNPRLLVFDEATSALDSITEEAISNTIRSIGSHKEHITVLIAHRLSTIRSADLIIVMEEGKIVESGSHEVLMKKKSGIYQNMVKLQTEHLG